MDKNSKKKGNNKNSTKNRKQPNCSIRTKKAWAELFEMLWAESDITLEPDEEIRQSKKPFPKYWFVTSNGRLYSIYYKRLDQLKPEANYSGSKREQLVWRYHYIENGNKKHVPVDKIVDYHFNKDEWADYDGQKDLHHIFGMKHWKEDDVFKASKKTNIQKIPRNHIHQFATMFAYDTEEDWINKNYRKLSDKELKQVEKILPNHTFTDGVITWRKVEDEDGRTGVKVVRGKNVDKIEQIEDHEENALTEKKDFIITDKYIFIAEDNGEFLEKNKSTLESAVDNFFADCVSATAYNRFEFNGVIVFYKKMASTEVVKG